MSRYGIPKALPLSEHFGALSSTSKQINKLSIAYGVLTLGCLFFDTILARCGKQNLTDWFGRLYYDQSTDKSSETCSWNFIPPQDISSTLILKVVSFPIQYNNMPERNYIVLPGGENLGERHSNTNVKTRLNFSTLLL